MCAHVRQSPQGRQGCRQCCGSLMPLCKPSLLRQPLMYVLPLHSSLHFLEFSLPGIVQYSAVYHFEVRSFGCIRHFFCCSIAWHPVAMRVCCFPGLLINVWAVSRLRHLLCRVGTRVHLFSVITGRTVAGWFPECLDRALFPPGSVSVLAPSHPSRHWGGLLALDVPQGLR